MSRPDWWHMFVGVLVSFALFSLLTLLVNQRQAYVEQRQANYVIGSRLLAIQEEMARANKATAKPESVVVPAHCVCDGLEHQGIIRDPMVGP